MVRPVVIGLSGGIASGKSAIAKMFARLGAIVLDADRMGHEVLNEEQIKLQVRQAFGDGPFDGDQISRQRLARIVFDPVHGREKLATLEKLTHPVIRERILDQLEVHSARGAIAVVLDAPLLFKAGWDNLCDKLVFVDCSEDKRIQRAMSRRWTVEEFREREKQQMPILEKRARSTDIIDNSGDTDRTFLQVQQLWKSWQLPVANASE